jgi:hypothetical protein
MPYLMQGLDNGVLERALESGLDQMCQHLGVGLRLEDVAVVFQHPSECRCVLYDPIVNDGDLTLLIDLRVGIHLVWRAVGGPASMADPEMAVHGGRDDRRLQSRDLARDFARLESLAVHDGQTCRVVSAVFEALEPLDQHWRDDFWTNVADNSTHNPPPFVLKLS